MALLGYVRMGDSQKLQEIVKQHNLGFINEQAVWQEAKDDKDSTGSSEAEVRLRGLDYIIVS